MFGAIGRDELANLFGQVGNLAAVLFDDAACQGQGLIVGGVVQADAEFLEIPHDLEFVGAGLGLGGVTAARQPDESFLLVESFLAQVDQSSVDIRGMGFLLERFETGDGGRQGVVEVAVMLQNSRPQQNVHHLLVVQFVIGDPAKTEEGEAIDIGVVGDGIRSGIRNLEAITKGLDIEGMLRFGEGFESEDRRREFDAESGIAGHFLGAFASEREQGSGGPGFAGELLPLLAGEFPLFAGRGFGGESPPPVKFLIVDGERFFRFDFELFPKFRTGDALHAVRQFIGLIGFLNGEQQGGKILFTGESANDRDLSQDIRDVFEGDGIARQGTIEDVVETGESLPGIVFGKGGNGNAGEVGFGIQQREQFGDRIDFEFSSRDFETTSRKSDFEKLGDGFGFHGQIEIGFQFRAAPQGRDGSGFISAPGTAETGVDPEGGFLRILFGQFAEFFGGGTEAALIDQIEGILAPFDRRWNFAQLIRRAQGIGDGAGFIDVIELLGDFVALFRIGDAIVRPLEVRPQGHHAVEAAVEISDRGGESDGGFGRGFAGDREGEIDLGLSLGQAVQLGGEKGIHQQAEGMLRIRLQERFDRRSGLGQLAGPGEKVGFDGEGPQVARVFGFDFFESGESLLRVTLFEQAGDFDHLFGCIVTAELEFLSASTGTEGVHIELRSSHDSRFSSQEKMWCGRRFGNGSV